MEEKDIKILEKQNAALKAKVTGMKYILVGMLCLELSRLLSGLFGPIAEIAGPIFCAVFVVYGVFVFFDYGMK